MNALFPAIIESQWILCLLQVTVLMSASWIVGRIALRKFPDISASVGVVALAASAGLIVLTWAGVPRPFELIANPNDQAARSTSVELSQRSVESLESTAEPEHVAASWLNSLAAKINWTISPSQNDCHSAAAESRSPAGKPRSSFSFATAVNVGSVAWLAFFESRCHRKPFTLWRGPACLSKTRKFAPK